MVEEEGADDRFVALFPLENNLAAFDDERIVATFGSFNMDLTVPGGAVPMAGTTIVTVQPTHRRRGILTQMMRMHLDQAIEHGQPVAGLWASEARIYGRFGYGAAAYSHDLTIPTDRVSLPSGPDSIVVRMITHEQAEEILPPLYLEVQRVTPGMFARDGDWWKYRRLRDAEHHRGGASSRRIVVAHDDGRAVGYATYRQKEKWGDEGPSGTVEVIEVMACSEDARRALWHYLTNIDLYPKVHWWNAPVDNPLYAEVDDPRRLTTKNEDTLWLRMLDVPRSLEARTYEQDARLVLAVSDEFMSAGGTFELIVDGGSATCRPTESAPELAMDISDLSSLYLGAGSPVARWRAGRIDGSQDAVHRLSRVFHTTQAPFCPEVF